MRPWRIHFGGEKSAKNNENLIVKVQQAAAKQYYFLQYLVFLFWRTSRQKEHKIGGENCIGITSRTLWTTTNKLEAGPAAKGRDSEGKMRRSDVCFFGLVATCDVPGTCPTQKLPLFFNLIQMGPWKNKSRISEMPRLGRYANIKKKKQKRIPGMIFCILTSMPAEYCYVPRVSYICRNSIPAVVLLFILTWGGVWCHFLVLLSTPA